MSEFLGHWTRDCTMQYLNRFPLPPTFKWEHRDGGQRIVQPSHRNVTGYGKWLRETPYFKGLFELIHAVLSSAPEYTEDFGEPEWLAEEISKMKLRVEQEKLPLT